jgi:hypothetical protein
MYSAGINPEPETTPRTTHSEHTIERPPSQSAMSESYEQKGESAQKVPRKALSSESSLSPTNESQEDNKMNKRFTIKLITISVAGIAWGAGPAAALSASELIPNVESPRSTSVETPYVSVPLVSTPALATPGRSLIVDVDGIRLPAGAFINLNGEVEEGIGTPESTPAVNPAVKVPSVAVDSVSAGGEGIDSQQATVDMPASASTSSDEANLATADDDAGASMEWTDSSWSANADGGERETSAGAELR